MIKRLIATMLAGALALTSTPMDTVFRELQDTVMEATEGEEQSENEISSEADEGSDEIAGTVSASENDETTEKTVCSDETSEADATEDQEGITSAEESNVTESGSEEALMENGTEMNSEVASDETVDETTEATENTDEVSSEEVSEEGTEEQVTEEREASFTQPVSGVDIFGVDFSSCELMIGTEDPTILTWDTEVLSKYRGVYLTRYASVEETRNAYTYYYGKAEFVSANITFRVADNENVQENGEAANSGDDETSDADDSEDHLKESEQENHQDRACLL